LDVEYEIAFRLDFVLLRS